MKAMEDRDTIVIDLGCKSYGGADDSIMPLISRYRPQLILGFDPQVEEEQVQHIDMGVANHRTLIVLSKKIGWTHGGSVAFSGDGVCAGVRGHATHDHEYLPCFDVAELISAKPSNARLIVKLDIEGGEYPLLSHLEAKNVIEDVDEFLVEWHTGAYTNAWNTAHGRDYYEAEYPYRFKLWHDPLHKRCCRA